MTKQTLFLYFSLGFLALFFTSKSRADSIDATVGNVHLIGLSGSYENLTAAANAEANLPCTADPTNRRDCAAEVISYTDSHLIFKTGYSVRFLKNGAYVWSAFSWDLGSQFTRAYIYDYECLNHEYPDLWSMNGDGGTMWLCSERFRISDEEVAIINTAINTADSANNQAQTAKVTATVNTSAAESSADNALNSAAQAASSKTVTTNNSTVINNYHTENPSIQTLTTAANTAQSDSNTASAAAAAALAAATDAAADAINANQKLLDVQSTANETAIAAAEAAAAKSAGLAAETQAAATAAVNAAVAAASAAESAITTLSSTLESISNSAIQASAASAAAAEAVVAAAEAAASSASAAATAEAAIKNGEICTGDKCIAVPDTEPEPEPDTPQTPTNGTPTGESFYTSSYEDGFGGVYTEQMDLIKQTEFYQSVENFGITVSGSGLPSWTFCFNTGFVNLGCHDLSVPAYVWSFLRLVILISAGFLCRSLIFGG